MAIDPFLGAFFKDHFLDSFRIGVRQYCCASAAKMGGSGARIADSGRGSPVDCMIDRRWFRRMSDGYRGFQRV
jgi:hypothetical protein